ncbi:hypothetical protein GTZ99_09700 [Novosphingobium sp. FSY-8]|uniref:Uncharacterized protein n=1 Tax=Novosphingobium ovatum TaxID=1908523 RepID=A0ABW9XE64_9SPHN|nr:hypothetical protein [Novosphingobium ovatum]NBC36830.1 hypothetical protein [Novosphingobium ovatum]
MTGRVRITRGKLMAALGVVVAIVAMALLMIGGGYARAAFIVMALWWIGFSVALFLRQMRRAGQAGVADSEGAD